MREEFIRTEMLLGSDAMKRLESATVIVFGVGGVGSFATEALARSGVGYLILVDHDIISPSNINRQLIATHETVGLKKVEVMKKRIESINPSARVETIAEFLLPGNETAFPIHKADYIIDAIDTVSAKILLAEKAQEYGVPIISSMGAGNKLDPTKFTVTDIYNTTVCPLARVMRRELRSRGVRALKVVYSTEPPRTPAFSDLQDGSGKRHVPGSVSYVPSVAGLILAGEVIRDLSGPAVP